MKHIDKYLVTSFIIWLVATIESIGGLLGYWSVAGDERLMIYAIEGIVLFALLVNCYAIKNWVYRHTDNASHRFMAWAVVVSLALCLCGDLVNFNLPMTYYRYAGVVKHDYLADSVLFFAPGYALLLILVCWLALENGFKAALLYTLLAISSLVGGILFLSMHLAGTGTQVSLVTGFYAVLITLVGLSGVIILIAFNKSAAKFGVWCVAAGLILAALADGIIGQFWIYGNNGAGFFPTAKYVNWSLYIGSQCLLRHLVKVAVLHEKGLSRAAS